MALRYIKFNLINAANLLFLPTQLLAAMQCCSLIKANPSLAPNLS